MNKLYAFLLFLAIVIGDMYGIVFHNETMEFIFKPLILIWICTYFLLNSRKFDKKLIQLAFTAFSFSLIGDILLMFGSYGEIYFILGLIAFFCAQIAYIFLFLRTINLSGKKSFLRKKPYFLIIYIAFCLVFFILLYDNMDGIVRVAVFAYMITLLGMSAMALNRYGNGHPVSFSYVFAGSVLFVISDSIIAINKFMVSFPNHQVYIMITYIGAQFLIMNGILKQYEPRKLKRSMR